MNFYIYKLIIAVYPYTYVCPTFSLSAHLPNVRWYIVFSCFVLFISIIKPESTSKLNC